MDTCRQAVRESNIVFPRPYKAGSFDPLALIRCKKSFHPIFMLKCTSYVFQVIRKNISWCSEVLNIALVPCKHTFPSFGTIIQDILTFTTIVCRRN